MVGYMPAQQRPHAPAMRIIQKSADTVQANLTQAGVPGLELFATRKSPQIATFTPATALTSR